MRSTVFKWTIYDSSWLLKFSPNVQRPWWIFGHDNIYVHCFIRRTSLFCGSFEEQPRKNIPKRFVWHFISAHVGSWLDELFRKCSSMRWDDCWDHNMIQLAVHTKSNCLYTQFWDYCEISICGLFVYRLGRKILNLERAVRFCYGLR